MAATIETTNAILAASIVHGNPGSSASESNGTWTVTHADKLTVTVEMAQRAGYSASYIRPPHAWGTTLRDMKTQGFISRHTFKELVIEAGAGDDMPFAESTEPTRAESQERPALTWRKRIRDDYGVV